MNWMFRSINVAVAIVLSVALFFSIQSSTLNFYGFSGRTYVIIFTLIAIGYLVVVTKAYGCFANIHDWAEKNQNRLFWVTMALLFIWQLVLLASLDTHIEADALTVMESLNNPEKFANYYSLSPNNFFYFLINYAVSRFFGTELIVFKIVNVVFIDLSVFFIRGFTKSLFDTTEIANITTLVYAYFYVLQPIFIFPYTDTYSLPFISAALYFGQKMLKNKTQGYLFAVMLGLVLGVIYFLRPSAVIFEIAFLVVFGLRFLYFRIQKRGWQIKEGLKVLTSLCAFALAILGMNYYIGNQSIIHIEKNGAFPITHYLLLGSSGDPNDKNGLHGTFNYDDLRYSLSFSDKDSRFEPEMKRFISRVESRDALQNFKLYTMKFSDNVDSGILGLHRDKLWSNVANVGPKSSFKGMVQRTVYGSDVKKGDEVTWSNGFEFALQILWLFILISAIVAVYKMRDSALVAFLSLSLFGGILFLEIFESGGTKYMIQYMPFLSILSGIGIFLRLNKLPRLSIQNGESK
ncbi:integral membrane protein [Streptococcus pneumoniae]|nr:integral membrane protein [Streptococcus pneumoniae]